MFCNNCGKEITEGSAFCSSCGAPVVESAQSQYNQQAQSQYNQQAQNNAANGSNSQGFFSDFSIATAPNEPGPNNGSVDLLTAIKLFFKNYTNFKGRASKSEYWWVMLFTLLIGFIPGIGTLLSLFCLIPGIAVALRRLHDTGKAGTYYFIALIPFVGIILLLLQMLKDSDGDNQYGPANPQTAQQYAQYQQYAQPQQYTQNNQNQDY